MGNGTRLSRTLLGSLRRSHYRGLFLGLFLGGLLGDIFDDNRRLSRFLANNVARINIRRRKTKEDIMLTSQCEKNKKGGK